MLPIRTACLSLALLLGIASVAGAHEAAPGSSGFLHVVGHVGHFVPFLIVGAMGGIYLYLFGGWISVGAAMLPLAVLSSHSHAPISTSEGLVFAGGFVTAGFVNAIVAARLVCALFARLGIRRADTKRP